jgi:hypothetical protein
MNMIRSCLPTYMTSLSAFSNFRLQRICTPEIARQIAVLLFVINKNPFFSSFLETPVFLLLLKTTCAMNSTLAARTENVEKKSNEKCEKTTSCYSNIPKKIAEHIVVVCLQLPTRSAVYRSKRTGLIELHPPVIPTFPRAFLTK